MTNVALIHFNHTERDGKVTWSDMGTTDARPNYGDMLVCASLLEQLDPNVTTFRARFGRIVQQSHDVALVRGSTYLNHRFDFVKATATVESIDSPLAIIGLGAQSPTQDVTFLDDNQDAKRFIEVLAEKSVSISVRGDFTAQVVERLGGKNIRVTGCPSLFYSRRIPKVRRPMMLASHLRRIGVSLHTGLRQSMYCSDPENARAKHVMAMSYTIRNSAKPSFFEQGVKLEFDLADQRLRKEDRRAAADSVLERLGGYGHLSEDELIAYMVSVRSIDEWLSKARDLDAMIGFRFHGNMVALLQSIPCFYWVYDSRLREFCDLYKLPYQAVSDPWQDPVEAMLNHDWDTANAAFRSCYGELLACYEENGIPHSLPATDTLDADAPVRL
ncbi:MAG: polysaccharide pyruvyl transferase family protein [Pseudomonadota bacterium]